MCSSAHTNNEKEADLSQSLCSFHKYAGLFWPKFINFESGHCNGHTENTFVS